MQSALRWPLHCQLSASPAPSTLTSCASNKDNSGSGSSRTKSGSGSTPSVDAAAAALVPSALKSKGVIKVGVDATYAPNEYKDPSDKIVGFDIDLFNAVAAELGLKATYVASNFDNIIPGITGGKYDVGVSSFTDNKEREKTVDFVTYYSAGIQFVSTDKSFDPDERLRQEGRCAGRDDRTGRPECPQQDLHLRRKVRHQHPAIHGAGRRDHRRDPRQSPRDVGRLPG